MKNLIDFFLFYRISLSQIINLSLMLRECQCSFFSIVCNYRTSFLFFFVMYSGILQSLRELYEVGRLCQKLGFHMEE